MRCPWCVLTGHKAGDTMLMWTFCAIVQFCIWALCSCGEEYRVVCVQIEKRILGMRMCFTQMSFRRRNAFPVNRDSESINSNWNKCDWHALTITSICWMDHHIYNIANIHISETTLVSLWWRLCFISWRDGFFCWLLNAPATCWCISGMDLRRQLYMLPRWDRNCRSNFVSQQSQYTDTGPTSPSADPIRADTWQASQRVAHFEVTGVTRSGKILGQAGIKPPVCLSRGGHLNQAHRQGFSRGTPVSSPPSSV